MTDAGETWARGLEITAYAYLAVVSVALTWIDIARHRLPDRIVLPSYLVAGILLSASAVIAREPGALLRAGVGMVALFAFYFVLRQARSSGMGGGDVKLAGVLGIYLGWIGWGALATGAVAAFVLGGLFAVVLLVTRRAGRRSRIPFGPWMILGAWIGIVLGESLARGPLGVAA